MGESDTVVSAKTMYKRLQQYCSHPLDFRHKNGAAVFVDQLISKHLLRNRKKNLLK